MAARIHRRDSSGHIDPFLQRRRRYQAVLHTLGIWDAFARVPRRVQEALYLNKFPDPMLEFDQTFPDDDEHQALRKTLERQFRETAITMTDGRLEIRDFFTVIAGLLCTIRDAWNQPGLPEQCIRFFHEARPAINACYEQGLPRVWDALHSALIVPLVAQGRLESRLFQVRADCERTKHDKSHVRVHISAIEPPTRRVQLDGAQRLMYQVGTSNEWNDIRWLTWDQAQLPGAELGREYPVFVQSHALRHLRERVNLPKTAPYLESWLHESLKHPLIVEKQGEDLFVEYRIHEYRIGYLIVTPLRDLVAVRTFLFLTMQGTPEARLLKQRLRLTRRDVDWLGLSDLTAFTQTDLSRDPVLRQLLEECGCGHLFSLAENLEGDLVPHPKPFAAEMKRYLRLAA